jgi:type III pantothenate kinase
MILVFDIGNTSTMVGMSENDKIIESFRMPSKENSDYKISVQSDVVAVKLRHFVFSQEKAGKKIKGAAICSVVPDLTDIYAEMVARLLNLDAWILDHKAELGLKIDVDMPEQAGADRLANAVALKNLYGYPGFVVDLGTSTNFDVVDQNGNYIGGAIAAGVKTSAAELFRRASQLYAVDIKKPEKAIGRNSTDAMRSGIFNGSLGLIDYISSLIIGELDAPDIKVIATGGYAELFAPHSKYIQKSDAELTLKGIAIAFRLNQG